MFSAGNSGDEGQDTNYHSYTNSRFTISVGALDHDGDLASFSTPGDSVLISAPGVSVVTTDRTGGSGYSGSDTTSISGTSFSAPATSGVVALILEANPLLGYRDVQEILAYSARQSGGSAGWETNAADNWNGGGLHVHHGYGYGFVDAFAAVRLAETWQTQHTFANEQMVSASSNPSIYIPDNTTITDTISLSSNLRIDEVEVDLDISHTWIGDLVVTLTSPDDTTSTLVNRPGKSAFSTWGTSQNDIDFTFSSTHHWGETGDGTWTLSVSDHYSGDQGRLNSWALRLFGDIDDGNDTYVYTDEYGGFTGAGDASRRVLSDASGTDTVNAAAVTGDSVIDLNPGAVGMLAGNSFSVASGTTIENVFAGDGADVLTGNAAANTLSGGRGDDTLTGGGGGDVLDGGSGSDRVSYGTAGSSVVVDLAAGTASGGEGSDVLVGIEHLRGSVYDDLLTGDGGANILEGDAGDDLLIGGAGRDVHVGGAGSDTAGYADAGARVYANLSTGWGYWGDARGDSFSSVENLTGSAHADILAGNATANTLSGGAGDDKLYGYGGDDAIDGGAGSDTVSFGSAGAGVTADLAAGTASGGELEPVSGKILAVGQRQVPVAAVDEARR